MPRQSTRERFYSRVNIAQGDACWEWTGSLTKRGGYGLFRIGGRKGSTHNAHRAAWLIEYGPIADGMVVMHMCDNPPCVRLDHLRLGSGADNMRDMAAKERSRTTRLTADQVNEIRRAADQHERHIDIAARYGISKSNVSMIATRQTWKHLPEVRDFVALLGGET